MRYIKALFVIAAVFLSTNYVKAQVCITLVTPGTNIQAVCINAPIVNIVYSLGAGVTGASASGLPAGVSGVYSPGTFVISGIPTVAGIFNYTVTTSGTCIGTGTATGTITVYALPTANAGPPLSPFCQGGTSAPLGGSVGGSATGGIWSDGGVGGTFLPAATNLNATWTPPAAFSANATLTLTTTGGSCGTATASKSQVVNPNAVITLTSGAGSNIQAVCQNAAISNITYSVSGGGTGAGVTGLPAGVNGSFSAGVFTISGTPSVIGTYNYTVTTTGTCTQATATGTIIVYSLPTATASNNGPVCPGTALNLFGSPNGMIAYSWTGPNGFNSSLQNPQVSASATTAMAGIYSLTVTNNNGCQRTATTTVVVRVAPVATASNNGPVCVGSPLNLTGGPTGMSFYSWTGPNGFTSNQRSPQVSASATVGMSGTYSLTVTDANGCTNTATTDAIVNALPVATASNNGPVCVGSPLTLTGGPPGMTSYAWTGPNGFISALQNPIVSANATLLMAGTYTLTVTSSTGCKGTATTTVAVNPLPLATASNNGPVCVGTLLTLTGGPLGMSSYSWIGPNGFTSTLQSPVVSPAATSAMAGIYTLTVTNSTGCQNTATTTVVVNPLPVASALNNGPVCAGSPLTLAGGPSGMSSYAWAGPNGYTSNLQSPTVSLAATPAMAGIYTLTVVNSNGCRNTATTTVVVNALPIATAVNNGPVCAGTPLILTGGPAGMTTYSWSGPLGYTSPLQSPTVSLTSTTTMSGIYTLTVTDANGCHNAASTTVVINPSPVATAANSGPVCVGSPLTLTGGPAGMTTYAWTGPNSFTSPLRSVTVSLAATLTQAGIYTLTVTNATGCQDTATTRAYVYAVPVSNAGSGGTECDLDFVLNAVPSVGIGLWTMVTGPGTSVFAPNPNSPAATVTVSAYGTYTFRWTETNGPCISSSVITVNFYQRPLANPGSGGNECDLDFVLNAVPSITAGTGTWTMTGGSGTATFVPDATSPVATVTVSEYGAKEFTWTEVNGTCSSDSAITVNFYQQPVADAGSGGNNCGLDFNLMATPSVGTGTWIMESGPGIASFNPNSSSPTAKVTVTSYGTYGFRWTELNGTCSSSATISVTFIQQPRADGGNGGDECDLNFTFNAVSGTGVGTWTKVSGPGNAVFTPNANQPNAIVTVSQFGVYDFSWTIVNSLCSSSDIVRVTFHDLPAVNAGTDLLLCRGRSVQLNATGNGISFQWSPPGSLNNPYISNPVATPQATTAYTVTLTDQWGCKNSDQINVEVRVQPVANAGPDQTLEFLFETNFEANPLITNQTGEWTLLSGKGDIDDKDNPTSHVSSLGVNVNSFIWTVTNGICPVSADTVDIKVNDLIIPTLITPNLDGANDYFVIMGLESFGKTMLTVFNRWGGRVYENPEYDNSWDGTDEKGNPLPEDTYFYVLKPENRNTLKGYLVIRR